MKLIGNQWYMRMAVKGRYVSVSNPKVGGFDSWYLQLTVCGGTLEQGCSLSELCLNPEV